MYRGIVTLGAITGNIGVVGGGTICGLGAPGAGLGRMNDRPIVFATESRSPSMPLAHLFPTIKSGQPYPIKGMLIYYWNPVHTYPNPRRWIEEVFPKLDIVVVSDIVMTVTAEYADYVLPDCTVYERDDIAVGLGGHVAYLEKAIDPMHEARPAIYLWTELARRLGLGEHFDKTFEE